MSETFEPHNKPSRVGEEQGFDLLGRDTRGTLFSTTGTLEQPWGPTPKANQAREMDKLGIRVPRVFANLNEGIEWLESHPAGEGYGLYIRSEHPDDGTVNARSGLLDSVHIRYVRQRDNNNTPAFFSPDIGVIEDKDILRAVILEDWFSGQIKNSGKVGFDRELTSFTVWEAIPGDNYTVVRDKNISGLYFIHPILVGGVDKSSRRVRYEEASELDRMLIDFYNNVQATHRFGDAPVVEIQMKYFPPQNDSDEWIQDKPYFLQALTTLPGVPSDWKLEREPEEGEVEAYFVRGVTPPGGIEARLYISNHHSTLYQYSEFAHLEGIVMNSLGLSHGEEKSLIESINSVGGDKIHILSLDGWTAMKAGIDSRSNFSQIADLMQGHVGISFFHKPKISLVLPEEVFFDDSEIRKEIGINNGMGGIATVRIVSDGIRAFVRIIK